MILDLFFIHREEEFEESTSKICFFEIETQVKMALKADENSISTSVF